MFCLVEHKLFPTPEGGNVGHLLSPLLFPSGDHCCDALACPCLESPSSLYAHLPCRAADQMWGLLCLPVYLPVISDSSVARAVDLQVFEVKTLHGSVCQASPSQALPFTGLLGLWEWLRVLPVCHFGRPAIALCVWDCICRHDQTGVHDWRHHCLCEQNFHPNQISPLWLSRPCRSRYHVACCWLLCAFVFLHWFFQLTIHGSACLGSPAPESRSRA